MGIEFRHFLPLHLQTSEIMMRQFLLLIFFAMCCIVIPSTNARFRKQCCDEVQVSFIRGHDNVWLVRPELFGLYKQLPGRVNGRPHYKQVDEFNHGIWWDGGDWMIGSESNRGKSGSGWGEAWQQNNDECPSDVVFTWRVYTGSEWIDAKKSLGVYCTLRLEGFARLQ